MTISVYLDRFRYKTSIKTNSNNYKKQPSRKQTYSHMVCIQLAVWLNYLYVRITSGICFEISILDWQEGLTVSSIIYDRWCNLQLVALKCRQRLGLWTTLCSLSLNSLCRPDTSALQPQARSQGEGVAAVGRPPGSKRLLFCRLFES